MLLTGDPSLIHSLSCPLDSSPHSIAFLYPHSVADIPENADDPFLTTTAIPEEFEAILNDLAANGIIAHPWKDLKRLLRWKICKVSPFLVLLLD
jgi:hypothetical protein